MSVRSPIRKRALLAAFAVLASFTAALGWWQTHRLKQYQVLQSPDGRFEVVVYRRSIWPSSMPGQAGDAPGVVKLFDRSGHLLDKAPIEMVQQANDIQWTPGHVALPLVFDWKLPD